MAEDFAEGRAEITPPSPKEVARVRDLSPEQIQNLREKAKNDLFFLAQGVLGYRDVNIKTHGPLCRFLERERSVRRMALMPRGHLKSTVATISDSIRLALRNPDECRILILNEVEDNAIGFLSEIKAHFENNEMLRFLFPEVIPEKTSGPGSKWSAMQACVRRSTGYKEWTWSVAGGKTAKVSQHYNHIKVDDIIGLEAKKSPAAMKAAMEIIDNLEPLLINLDEDTIDFIGTRKLIHDAYAHAIRLWASEIVIFRRKPIENNEPIFPQKFSYTRLMKIKNSRPEFYAAEYENDPVGKGSRDFDIKKVRPFVFANNGDVVYREGEAIQRWPLSSLNRYIAADPNSGEDTAPDFCAISVTGVSPKDQIFVLESWSGRVAPDAQVDKIFELAAKWNVPTVGIEKAGQQNTHFYFEKLARERKLYFTHVELKPRNRDKPTRIRGALQPIINEGRLFVMAGNEDLRRQIEFHPDLENDDEIDALSYGTEPEMWRVPVESDDPEEEEDREEERMVLVGRSRLTGY